MQGYHPPQGPPPGYGSPQQYPPQGSYPPQAAYGGGPPQGYYGQAPAQPPPGQYPPQAPYGAPPMGFGAPPPTQAQYGAPAPYTAPPSPGYDLARIPQIDATPAAEALRKSMKGLGTDERSLTRTLITIPDPIVMANVVRTFHRLYNRDLLKDIHSETSSYFREALLALARGPLAQDVHLLHSALSGAGTNENMLNDVLLNRTNADIHAIKSEYHRLHKTHLESAVRSDLSFKTERLFDMVLAANRADESAPVYPDQLQRDVYEFYQATEGRKVGCDQITVCRILSSRSDGQIRAISAEYKRQYQNTLVRVLNKNFDGHMQDALVRIVGVAEDRAKTDAEALEYCMKGAGTKDALLIGRLVKLHWEPMHMQQVKGAYRVHFKKELGHRVKGETSGDYGRLMVALVDGPGGL